MRKGLFLGILFVFFVANMFSQELSRPFITADATERLYKRLLIQHDKVVTFIENKLLENGLPQWLSNLALVESHFDKEAVSPVGAAGIWQFTEEHARTYGLSPLDRFDVYKSTLVAIRSLKRMYQKYGNWITVVAAYNCGEGCVDGAIKKKGSQNYVDFAVFLPQETLNHVDKFIEACYITGDFKDVMVHKQFYTFVQEQEQEKIITTEEAMFSTTEITSSFNLNVLSEEIGFPLTEILKWNPLIEKEIATTGVGTLRLPVDKMPDFLLMKHTILNKSLLVQK